MAVWITPVFDRTQADVDFATAKIAEWIAGKATRSSIVTQDLKGCLNASDLNRIEGNIAFLTERLIEYGYPVSTYGKTWERGGMPNELDVERIITNVRALVRACYTPGDSPSVPSSLRDYSSVNAVEENLWLIKEIIDVMVASFRKSGTFYSGSTLCLPTRR